MADCGDVFVTPYDLKKTAEDIHAQFSKLLSTGCKTLAIGGDHTVTYPILKAYKVNNNILRAKDYHLFFIDFKSSGSIKFHQNP